MRNCREPFFIIIVHFGMAQARGNGEATVFVDQPRCHAYCFAVHIAAFAAAIRVHGVLMKTERQFSLYRAGHQQAVDCLPPK